MSADLIAPPTLIEALRRAGIPHAAFSAALEAGMRLRDRFTTSAGAPLSPAQLSGLPAMTATINGTFVDVDIRLSETATANLRQDRSRLTVELCAVPVTFALAYQGGPLAELVDHPLLRRATPIVASIDQRTPTELRVTFHEEPVRFP